MYACMYVCMSVCLAACVSVCLSVCLCVCLFACVCVLVCVCLLVWLFVFSICLIACLSVGLFLCLSVCSSVCLFVWLFAVCGVLVLSVCGARAWFVCVWCVLRPNTPRTKQTKAARGSFQKMALAGVGYSYCTWSDGSINSIICSLKTSLSFRDFLTSKSNEL